MAETNHAKIMGQAKPAATTDTVLYTVSANTEAQGTLTSCNQAATDDKVRVALVKSGEVLAAKHYVLYDATVPANGALDKSFELGAGDELHVYSTAGNVSFAACGLEVS
jgi:hypothetical protein